MRYQDYVIKDGKFIGKFEEMYQEYENPWMLKEETEISYNKNDTYHTINRFKLNKVLEVGCGPGHFTNKLATRCPNTTFIGIDISPTAIRRARENYPNITFVEGGVRELDRIFDLHEFDGIIFAEILWYILDDLDVVLKMLTEKYKGLLIVNQVFYKGQQQYGTGFFTNQEEMIDYIDLNVVVKNTSDVCEREGSYETHTVFRIP